jgi:hypothetical protein
MGFNLSLVIDANPNMVDCFWNLSHGARSVEHTIDCSVLLVVGRSPKGYRVERCRRFPLCPRGLPTCLEAVERRVSAAARVRWRPILQSTRRIENSRKSAETRIAAVRGEESLKNFYLPSSAKSPTKHLDLWTFENVLLW